MNRNFLQSENLSLRKISFSSSQKKLLMAFVAIVLVFSTAGCKKTESPENNPATPPATQEGKTDDGLMNGSLWDLMKMGKSLKCEIVYTDKEASSKSVVYASGDKLRTDIVIANETGEEIESHTIVDGEWIWMWTDGQEQGTKMKIEDQKEDPGETPAETDSQVQKGQMETSLEEKFDYQCSPWTVDDALFSPPGNIEFIDLSATLKEMESQAENALEEACQMCENIPEPAKSQCLQGCQ